MTHPTLELHGQQLRHKKRIPTDVSQFYASKFLTFSTATTHRATARAECALWLAQKEAEFQQHRCLAAPPVMGTIPLRPNLTPQDIGKALLAECERFRLEKLAADAGGVEMLHPELRTDPDRRLAIVGIEEESARLAADCVTEELPPFIAIGLSHLRSVGVLLNDGDSLARQVGIAFAETALDVAEVIRQRADKRI